MHAGVWLSIPFSRRVVTADDKVVVAAPHGDVPPVTPVLETVANIQGCDDVVLDVSKSTGGAGRFLRVVLLLEPAAHVSEELKAAVDEYLLTTPTPSLPRQNPYISHHECVF